MLDSPVLGITGSTRAFDAFGKCASLTSVSQLRVRGRSAKVKIVAVGEVMIDQYPNLNRSFVGGISLNMAVNAKRCGADAVSLVSCVGADEGGRRVFEKLAQEGIDASHVAVLAGETARIDIQVVAQGERLFPPGGFHRNVLLDLRLDESDLAFIGQHDVLAFLYDRSQPESPANRALEALDFDGMRVADFGDWADYAGDYDLLVSALEPLALAFISGNQATVDFLLPFSRGFDGLIVVTLGAGGSVALVDGPLCSSLPRSCPTLSILPVAVMPSRPLLPWLSFPPAASSRRSVEVRPGLPPSSSTMAQRNNGFSPQRKTRQPSP